LSAPLSKLQKRKLSVLSRRAWRNSPDADALDETSFRHAQVVAAVGLPGLRACTQDHYKRIQGHFLLLLGNDAAAFEAHVRAETEPRRVARRKLNQALAEFNLPLSYAQAICRRQNRGLGLDDVGPKTLWYITFTIRNRGTRKRAA